ncbi:carbamate kinase [soil metagenome]
MRVVVALGGNAILRKGARGSAEEQRDTVRSACAQLTDLVEAGHELILTHGNGPQVGRLLIQQRAAAHEVPAMPLDLLGAQTQGMLGVLLQQQLGNELRARGLERPVVTVVTQVLVDAHDPAFDAPDKPVGPHYTETELEFLTATAAPAGELWTVGRAVFRKVEGGLWRRVVASPQPLDIMEAVAIRALVGAGVITVCAGGGGMPVALSGRALAGVEAVIDKDRTAALLTRLVEADALLVLTDVDAVRLGYGTPEERPIDELSPEDARKLLADGEFPAGSMGPKVSAAADVAARGAVAVISSLACAADALAGRAGTRFVAP